MGYKKMKWILITQMMLFFYSAGGICSKLAARESFLSVRFVLYYGVLLLILAAYAVGWQQVIKHLPLTFACPEEYTLEMTYEGVSKALGLEKLAEALGISMEETVGIGDGDNDRAVLEAVGLSVAMGNADPGLRDLCTLVTDDNDHNGVGKAIRKILG